MQLENTPDTPKVEPIVIERTSSGRKRRPTWQFHDEDPRVKRRRVCRKKLQQESSSKPQTVELECIHLAPTTSSFSSSSSLPFGKGLVLGEQPSVLNAEELSSPAASSPELISVATSPDCVPSSAPDCKDRMDLRLLLC